MKTLSVLFLFLIFSTSLVMAQTTETKTLKVGDTIPEVTLQTLEGAPFKLHADQLNEPLVIIYYRANWCPYCSAHLSDLQPYFKPLMKLGYKLIAISTDAPADLKKTKDNNFLKYTLLSDNTMEGIQKFGIVNGNVAVPSVFIVDANHIVQDLYTNTDYKKRLSGEEVYNRAKVLKK